MVMKNKENKEKETPQNNQSAAEKSQEKEQVTDNSAQDSNTDSGNDETDKPDQKRDADKTAESKAEEEIQDKIDEKQLLIKTLEEKNKELNDKYLRLFSEFDNFRKRSMKEKNELIKTAAADIIEAVLPVLDDLERAYESAVESPDENALTEGLNLIQTKLKTTLKQKGLEEIPGVGEPFNTDYHEAVTNTPAKDDKEKGKVVDQIQKGYLLNGKVLRFAKVVVAN